MKWNGKQSNSATMSNSTAQEASAWKRTDSSLGITEKNYKSRIQLTLLSTHEEWHCSGCCGHTMPSTCYSTALTTSARGGLSLLPPPFPSFPAFQPPCPECKLSMERPLFISSCIPGTQQETCSRCNACL